MQVLREAGIPLENEEKTQVQKPKADKLKSLAAKPQTNRGMSDLYQAVVKIFSD